MAGQRQRLPETHGTPALLVALIMVAGCDNGGASGPNGGGTGGAGAHLGGAGGTGRTFDWSLIREIEQPLWLAGGLNPDNVAQAVRSVNPDWVDVSSGVEDKPGIKNAALVRAFIETAKGVRT